MNLKHTGPHKYMYEYLTLKSPLCLVCPYVYMCVCVYIYICICFFIFFFACAKLHASKVGNWSVFVSVSFFVCVFECYFLLLTTGECLAWDLGSRSYSYRLGSSYPIKLLNKYK